MQPLITKQLLANVGITLPADEEQRLLDHLNATLEERVGAEVTESLTDEQLATLVDLQEKASDEEIGAWLSTNVPELQEITQDEIDIILGELAENTDGINTAS